MGYTLKDVINGEIMTNYVAINTLARWHFTFNSWSWPEDFPIPKPVDFNTLPMTGLAGVPNKLKLITPLMDAIKVIIGDKECDRYWKVWNEDTRTMTNDEFEKQYEDERIDH